MADKAKATATPEVERIKHGLDDCERVAAAIREIGETAASVVAGPLTMRALCVLVHDNMPASRRPGLSTVQEVLESAATLGRYVARGK